MTFLHDDVVKTDGIGSELNYLANIKNVDYEFYNIYNNGKYYGCFALGFYDHICETHFAFDKFTKKNLRHLRKTFEAMKIYCKERGAKTLHAPKYETQEEIKDTWGNFINFFGYEKPYKFRIAELHLEEK